MVQLARKSTVRQETHERIMLSAERLFSKYGIDAVSMRQINVAAGQRNSSAAHYHFGSKEALITVTFHYRMERINRRRLQKLDEISKAGQVGDVRVLVQAILLPILEEMEQSKGGRHYIRFAVQCMGHPQFDFFALRRSEDSAALQHIFSLIKAAVPGVPGKVVGQRFGMVMALITHSLADREIFRLSTQARTDFYAAAFLNNLVDSCTSVLTAPVSDETQLAIGQPV